MVTLLLWWAGIFLEALILFRMFKNRVFYNHPFFSIYLACVFLSSASGYILYAVKPSAYRYWYWGWEAVCVLAGYGVAMEILEKALASYNSPRKLARDVALIVFACVVALTTLEWQLGRNSAFVSTSVELERNLRAAELVLLALIISVISYYGIPVGRNLKGILLGYGFVVAVVVMDNALRSYVGPGFQAVFSSIRSYSYMVVLLIWAVTLWSYSPNPVPEQATTLTADYQALTSGTKEALAGMRDYLRQAAGSSPRSKGSDPPSHVQ